MSTVAAWLDDDRAIALEAFRPQGSKGHDADVVRAFLVEEDVQSEARTATVSPSASWANASLLMSKLQDRSPSSTAMQEK